MEGSISLGPASASLFLKGQISITEKLESTLLISYHSILELNDKIEGKTCDWDMHVRVRSNSEKA